MSTLLNQFREAQKRDVIPDIRPGDVVRVHERIQEAKGERIQVFEGLVISRKHGAEPGATFSVRKTSSGIGVERTFALHSPLIEKVEITKRSKVRRAKLYYMRKRSGRAARMRGVERSDVFDMTAKADEPTEETDNPEVPEENTEAPGSAEEIAGEEMVEAPEEETTPEKKTAPEEENEATTEEPTNEESAEEAKKEKTEE